MKRLVAFVAFMLLLGACGASPADQLRRQVATIDHTQEHPHGFTYTDETLDGKEKIVVDGHSSDDFKYTGTVSINGRKLYSMIVTDDAVALKLLDLNATRHVIDYAKSVDTVTGDALEQGKWVVDFTSAPVLKVIAAAKADKKAGAAAASQSSNPIGNDPFFDAADALHYAERSINNSFGLGEFNPEGIEYNPADDPWASDAKVNLRNEGIRRYDLVQPGLPQRAQRGQQQRLPEAAHFRKMAIYIKGERTIEIKEQVSIVDRKEFRRALTGRAAKYYIELRDAALAGAVASPMRERRMDYVVKPFTGAPVVLPADAVKGILKDVIGDEGLKTLFKFKIIGQQGGPGLLPGGLPAVVPSASP